MPETSTTIEESKDGGPHRIPIQLTNFVHADTKWNKNDRDLPPP